MGTKPQQRMVKWGRMRSQHGVFKKCLTDLIAFQYALHSFSSAFRTGHHTAEHWQTCAYLTIYTSNSFNITYDVHFLIIFTLSSISSFDN